MQELTTEHPVSDNPKGYANPQLLITTEALSERFAAGSEPPVLLDLRPAEAFAAGHIPGAVHLDLFGVSLIDTDPAPLSAFLWMIGHLLASRGVDPERTVVVYHERSGAAQVALLRQVPGDERGFVFGDCRHRTPG